MFTLVRSRTIGDVSSTVVNFRNLLDALEQQTRRLSSSVEQAEEIGHTFVCSECNTPMNIIAVNEGVSLSRSGSTASDNSIKMK